MSEAAKESSSHKPIEAHPEKPLVDAPLTPIDKLQLIAQNHPNATRRTVIGGTLAFATAAGLGIIREAAKRSNAGSEDSLNTISKEADYNGPQVDLAGLNEEGYFLTDVAEYIDLEKFAMRELYDENGTLGYEAPILHYYNPDKEFEEAPVDSIDPDTQLAEDVRLVRLAIKAENGTSNKKIFVDRNDRDKNIDIWLGFAKENPEDPQHPLWTDKDGNPLTDTVHVVSPVFVVTK